jgi:hypothetical protein
VSRHGIAYDHTLPPGPQLRISVFADDASGNPSYGIRATPLRRATDARTVPHAEHRHMSRINVAIVALLVSAIPAGAATAPAIPLRPCQLTGGIEALCGRYSVPEDRSSAGGRSISLRLAVVPARTQPAEPDPRQPTGSTQDPLSHVAGAGRELPSSLTVVVPAAGHTAAHLGCMPRVVQAFVERGSAHGLDTRCVSAYRPPPFVIG